MISFSTSHTVLTQTHDSILTNNETKYILVYKPVNIMLYALSYNKTDHSPFGEAQNNNVYCLSLCARSFLGFSIN